MRLDIRSTEVYEDGCRLFVTCQFGLPIALKKKKKMLLAISLNLMSARVVWLSLLEATQRPGPGCDEGIRRESTPDALSSL